MSGTGLQTIFAREIIKLSCYYRKGRFSEVSQAHTGSAPHLEHFQRSLNAVPLWYPFGGILEEHVISLLNRSYTRTTFYIIFSLFSK